MSKRRTWIVLIAACAIVLLGIGSFVWWQAQAKAQKEEQLMDAVKLMQVLNTQDGVASLTDEEKAAADVNEDGVIDMLDVNLLLKSNVGLE